MTGILAPFLPRVALIVVLTAALLPVAQPGSHPAAAADHLLETVCPANQVPEAGFLDIAGNTHESAIDCVAWHNVSRGLDADRYAPTQAITRDQMASFIASALPYDLDPPSPTANFGDVAGNTHANSINLLANLGIVQGTAPGTYAPRRPVSRAQMATFVVRTAEHVVDSNLQAPPSDFIDIATNSHQLNIAKAAQADLASGTTPTNFNPSRAVRRDQMASFVARLMGYLAGEDDAYLDLFRNGPKDSNPENGYLLPSPIGDDTEGDPSEGEGDSSDDDSSTDDGSPSGDGEAGTTQPQHGADVDESTTGPTAFYADDLGRELTYQDLQPSGSLTSSHDGQVIERRDISGTLTIAHKNVTVRASRITNPDGSYSISYAHGSGATNATVDHVEIDGTGNSDRIGVHLRDFTMTHSEIYGHSTGVRFGSNSTIEYSYIHSQALQEGSHNTAMSIHGGAGAVIRLNNLEGSTSSALSLYPRTAPIQNVLVAGNLFNGGSFCTYAGYSKEHKDSNHDIRYLENKFGRSLHDECGRYGPVTNWNPDQPGNEWTNNTWIDTGHTVE